MAIGIAMFEVEVELLKPRLRFSLANSLVLDQDIG
jgi:hypothetical protein